MLERTTTVTVIFKHAWTIAGMDGPLAAGPYVVETDEELIPGLSFIAYRRVRTSIVVPSPSGAHAMRQVADIDPDDLAAALRRDAADGARQASDPT